MRINLCISKILTLCFLMLLHLSAGAQDIITGQITLQDGITPLSGVGVAMTGSSNAVTLTDANGHYTFVAPAGGSYSVQPFANVGFPTTPPLNGITTFDIVLMMMHVEGIENLSPYGIIAADLDNSHTVTLEDSLIMRNLILGIINTFPDNELWRFVRADYVFPDPLHPFPYPTNAVFNNFDGFQEEVNFFGIRRADLNLSAVLPDVFVEGIDFSRIKGKATLDLDNDCTEDAGESYLAGWLVVASGLAGEFVSTTSNGGTYSIQVPEGDFTVSLLKPNALWNVCTPPQVVHVDLADTVDIPFSAQIDKFCPRMEVDLSTDRLRRCFTSNYYLEYCNKGTLVAQNAYVEVDLDPFLTLESSSIPWSTSSGNRYTFPVGNVEPGECGTFYLSVLVSCETELGQAHCTSAHIFPDSLCGPANTLWDGANLRVTGACNGDNVEFTVTNEGADMDQPAEYVIIEDIMIQMASEELLLAHNQSQLFTVPANGSTWRMEVDQSIHHPWSLFSSAAVEGCGTNGNGTFSHGLVTLFPQDDAPVFEDEDCTENQGSYDPNDKQGFPKGVGEAHYIPKGEEIEYLIRFQNTGTDTAFTVMILDTISSRLDLTTLRTGASSHPYTFNLYGQGVAQFTFSNIMLPDSNVNETASHGFVKFTISPKTGLPDGTELENQAGIYFDFNDPVITNRTLHTIGEPEQYLEVTQVENLQSDVSLSVFPNPARTEATFQLKTSQPLEGNVVLYNLQGGEVKRFSFSSNTFKINVADLPSGRYVFRLDAGGKVVSSGKILVENGQ